MVCTTMKIKRQPKPSHQQIACYNRSRVGWKPVILSMKTAKRHPDYEAINAMIDGPFVDFDVCFLMH
jgi:hypothetical protein